MNKAKKFFATMAIVGLVTTATVPVIKVQAEESAESIVVSYIVVNVKNTSIVIDITTYSNILLGLEDPSFENYLKDGKEYIELTALKVGNKYVNLSEYALNLLDYNGNISQAVANTPSTSTVSYKKLVEFNTKTGQPELNNLGTTLSDLNPTFITVSPGVYAVKVALKDAKIIGADEKSTLLVKIANKDDLLFSYNAQQQYFYIAAIQGYTEYAIKEGEVSLAGASTVGKTVLDLNPTIMMLVPNVYTLKISLADARSVGAVAGSNLNVKIRGKEDIVLSYNAAQQVFYNANIQGYTLKEIQSGTFNEQSTGTLPIRKTFSDLKGTVIQFAPGVFAAKISLAEVETLGFKADSIVALKVAGKDDINLSYNAAQKVFMNANIQGYVQSEIENGVLEEL